MINAVSSLPTDGTPDAILTLEVTEADKLLINEGPQTVQFEDPLFSCESTSFLPQAQPVQTEEDAIHSTIAGQDPLEWPQVGDTALSEFRTEGLASKLCPTLFPFGQGDPTSTIRHHPVTLADAFKHNFDQVQ